MACHSTKSSFSYIYWGCSHSCCFRYGKGMYHYGENYICTALLHLWDSLVWAYIRPGTVFGVIAIKPGIRADISPVRDHVSICTVTILIQGRVPGTKSPKWKDQFTEITVCIRELHALGGGIRSSLRRVCSVFRPIRSDNNAEKGKYVIRKNFSNMDTGRCRFWIGSNKNTGYVSGRLTIA